MVATLIQGKWLSAGAKQGVLESKLVALRNVVTAFSATGGSGDVSTGVLAAATTDTPVTALTSLGIYVGTVANAISPVKVLIRAAGTDNGIDDGTGDEIYGVLSEATGVYTLTFKKADGTGFTFGASTPIDYYFVEVFNEYTKPVNAHLLTAIGGVIDATSASALVNHINDATGAHAASAISVLDVADQLAATDVEAALAEIMDAAQAAQVDATQALADAATADGKAVAAQADATQALADAATADGKAVAAQADATQALADAATADGKAVAAQADATQALADAATADGKAVAAQADATSALGKAVKVITEIKTLTSAKFVELASAIKGDFNAVSLIPVGGIEQEYTVCFTAANDGTAGVGKVTWDGLGLDGVLESGEKIIVRYTILG